MLQSDLPAAGETSFTRQQEPLGLGHAVWCAREIVGDEPFALLLPDMLHFGPRGCLSEMMDVYSDNPGSNVIAVYEVPLDQVHQYGIVGVGEKRGKGFRVTGMVEKPKAADAPSRYMISGRYILQPDIFKLLATQGAGAGGEIQVTDAMLTLADRQPFYGYPFAGRIYDTGNKLGFLTANVAYALARNGPRAGLARGAASSCSEGVRREAYGCQRRPTVRDIGGVVGALHVRLQPLVAHLALHLPRARQLVDDAGGCGVAMVHAVRADVVVEAVAELGGADQPAPERMIDLHPVVVAEHAGDARRASIRSPTSWR